jgi:hypothetical protein
MRMHKFFLVCLAVVMLFLYSLPGTSIAATRHVVTSLSTCPTTSTGFCFTNINDAITNINTVAGDTILIGPGIYQGNFTVDKNLNFQGSSETAATILKGGGDGAVLTLNNVTSSKIRRLTFVNAAAGSPAILVQNSSGVEISNTIIEAGETSTGVQIVTSTNPTIINNTFYRNLKGIDSNTPIMTIVNNIFYQVNGATAISPANADLSLIKNNLFFGGTIGPNVNVTDTTTNYFGNIGTTQDPLFVSPNATAFVDRDFHLKTGSPAINTGDISSTNRVGDTSKADIGAYGGGNADTIPFPITDLRSAASGSTVTLTWTANPCYLVTGYNVYTTTTNTYGAPVDAGLVTSYSFTQATVVTSPTGTPVLSNTFSSGTLILVWDASSVSGANGYEVRYGTLNPPTNPIDAGPTITYPLTGLQNGIKYFATVVPYALNEVSAVVTAYYAPATPAQESDYSNEVSEKLGSKLYGTESNVIEDTPEMIVAQPDLPNSGCFIATAAYGSYSAPEVLLLRRFRDAYLLTNAPGRKFVAWYYHYGPVAADFVNDHPWLKPGIRMALLPALGSASFLLDAPLPVRMAGILFLGFLSLYLLKRKKSVHSSGGTR